MTVRISEADWNHVLNQLSELRERVTRLERELASLAAADAPGFCDGSGWVDDAWCPGCVACEATP